VASSASCLGPGGRIRAWLASAVVVAGALGCLAAKAEAVPASFWGVVPQEPPTQAQLERLKRGGVDSVRIGIDWATIQPESGVPPDWSGVDAAVGQAAAAGLEVLPFITGAPKWAVRSVVVNAASHSFAPANLPVRTAAQREGWQALLGEAVRRYGPSGAFWSQNPAIPQRPVRTWQIWNEENFKYFVAHPNPAEYGKLVTLSSTAIRAADPGARVILGGMFARPKEAEYRRKPPSAYFATDFLDLMYKRTPGVKARFQGVALHPYTYDYHQLTPDIEAVRTVLKRHRDAGKGLWITELGWSSGRPRASNGFNGFEKGPSGQAAQLKGAFRLFVGKQARWRLRQIFWFSVGDAPGACNFCDGSGLFGPGFVAKPSWKAYVRFAGGRAG
jgi:hypothetical protein